MADSAQVGILRRGKVEEWNEFVTGERFVDPDWSANLGNSNLRGALLADANLSGADLSNTELQKANLSGAWLDGANLSGANLNEAELSRANLRGANLAGANLERVFLALADLRHADLRCVDLHEATLAGANLSGANLSYAFLAGADLREVNLSGTVLINATLRAVRLAGTQLANIDLRTTRGLQAVNHRGPSTVGTNTLALSHGLLPPQFLRGCGLSDWEIEAAKLWSPNLDPEERTTIWYEVERIRGVQPFAMNRIFISYTGRLDDDGISDEPFVAAIEQRFDAKGVRYWRDVHDMKAGRIEKQIDRAITLNRRVLLILSGRSVVSDWVEWETTKAREIENDYRRAGQQVDVLCPIALDNSWKTCDWPAKLRTQIEKYNILDFSDWQDDAAFQRQFAKLYDGLILNYQG